MIIKLRPFQKRPILNRNNLVKRFLCGNSWVETLIQTWIGYFAFHFLAAEWKLLGKSQSGLQHYIIWSAQVLYIAKSIIENPKKIDWTD